MFGSVIFLCHIISPKFYFKPMRHQMFLEFENLKINQSTTHIDNSFVCVHFALVVPLQLCTKSKKWFEFFVVVVIFVIAINNMTDFFVQCRQLYSTTPQDLYYYFSFHLHLCACWRDLLISSSDYLRPFNTS